MAESDKYPYIGVPQEDGNIKIEGPLSEENYLRKPKSEKGVVVGTRAKNPGIAILNVISTLISSEHSKI